MNTQIFGIRHHGPGSARSLLRALEAFEPQAILIEGPPDANEILNAAADAEMKPPVALLVYDPESPQRAAFYPFSHFSPEWQALRFALARGLPVAFMDLPRHLAASAASKTGADTDLLYRSDPLLYMAQAAGYTDGERWWEDLVEQGQDGHIFEAIAEMMTALRAEFPEKDAYHLCRESAMRLTLAQWQAEYERLAVVCGAWHLPALQSDFDLDADRARLQDLRSTPMQAAWVPWTQGRLSLASGYGAGVASPGWYAHLFDCPDQTLERWLVRVGQILRQHGHEVSSAHLIEASRLSTALAALREKAPGLSEINDAIVSVLCNGASGPLQILQRELILGEVMGTIPENSPKTPLQLDFERRCKALRLQREAQERELHLDLRKERDRDKSLVFYRLQLLNIHWGQIVKERGRLGTFNERWCLRWEPEFEIRLIEASMLGHSIEEAAVHSGLKQADQMSRLSELCRVLEQAMFAELPKLIQELLTRLQRFAALHIELSELVGALPPLVQILKYGNVRETRKELVEPLVEHLIAQSFAALDNATQNLDEEAAQAMLLVLQDFQASLTALNTDEYMRRWEREMMLLRQRPQVPGLIQGYACRQSFESELLSSEALQREVNRALAYPVEMKQACQWLQGFLTGSGLILIHNPVLLREIDRWLRQLARPSFQHILPLLRRSFSRFAPAERRQMGQLIRQVKHSQSVEIDLQRAQRVVPLLKRFFEGRPQHG